jgi:membrane-associated phospholipid phosphatase
MANAKMTKSLPAPRLLARRPIIGLLMFFFGVLAFGGLLYNLRANGPLLAWDNTLANNLPPIALKGPAFLKGLMNAGFYIGKEYLIALAVLLGLFFLVKRYWNELILLAVGLGGSSLFFSLLSNSIGRPRPSTQIWILVKIPGFPSGHAMSVIVFYGLVAYLLAPKMPSLFWKIVVSAAALLVIGFVGFSRVFTGGHYLTDILAGYAVAIAWSGVAYTLVEMFFQGRRLRNVKNK